jgi:rsbT antagonist protein RsbS
MENTGIQKIPLQVSNNCVVASIQIDLTEEALRQFRNDLLERLQSSGAAGVILDVSGVEIMDADDFNALRRTMFMAEIMGAKTVIAGLKPGVVSALVELNANIDNIHAALDLDDAFRVIKSLRTEKEFPLQEQQTEKLDNESEEDLDTSQD